MSVIATTFPGVKPDRAQIVEAGWDYLVLIVDDDIVFRLPRTPADAEHVMVDVRLLEKLRDHRLGIEVPAPHFVSTNPALMGYRRIPGDPVRISNLVISRVECRRLGRFLDRLHRIPVDEAKALGLNIDTRETWRRAWSEAWQRYRKALPLLPADIQAEAVTRWDDFLRRDTNFEFEPALIHGDLTPQHILWSDGRLSGVIDWSDAQVGDVALDFAWPMSLPRQAAEAIVSTYSACDTTRLVQRAHFFRWTGGWSDAVHGMETGDDVVVERGLRGVIRDLR